MSMIIGMRRTGLQKSGPRNDGLLEITCDTYGARVLLFCGQRRKFERLIKARYKVSLDNTNFASSDGFSLDLGINDFLIFLRGYHDDLNSVGILCHESLHIACFILASRGVEIDLASNTECLNYLQEEIFKKCLSALLEWRKTSAQRKKRRTPT